MSFIPWIIKSGFVPIHFTVTSAGLKNVKRYIGNIIISKIVISGFHCITIPRYNEVILPVPWYIVTSGSTVSRKSSQPTTDLRAILSNGHSSILIDYGFALWMVVLVLLKRRVWLARPIQERLFPALGAGVV